VADAPQQAPVANSDVRSQLEVRLRVEVVPSFGLCASTAAAESKPVGAGDA
jgi:hypothetical protein